MDSEQLSQLASSLSKLRSGKYSDFIIRCSDGDIIPAHRAIVCTRSRVLAAAMDGKFKESTSQEIYLEDDEPDIVAKMMDFMYGIDYDDYRSTPEEHHDGDQNVDESSSAFQLGKKENGTLVAEIPIKLGQVIKYNPLSLTTNAKVYIIADKNDIQALKEWASKKYKEVLPGSWNSLDFTQSARLIFENTLETDRILRDIIVQGASTNIKDLLDRGEFVDFLKRNGDFTIEVLKEVVRSGEQKVDELDDMQGLSPMRIKKPGR